MIGKYKELIDGRASVYARKQEVGDGIMFACAQCSSLNGNNALYLNCIYAQSQKIELNCKNGFNTQSPNNAKELLLAASVAINRKNRTDCNKRLLHPPIMRTIVLYAKRAALRKSHYDRIMAERESERTRRENAEYAKTRVEEAKRILSGQIQ